MARKAAEHRAGLLLYIDGVGYWLRPQEPPAGEGWVRSWRLRKEGAKGDEGRYDVAAHRDGYRTCTCGDFIWRRDQVNPEGCKHARALAAFTLLPEIP